MLQFFEDLGIENKQAIVCLIRKGGYQTLEELKNYPPSIQDLKSFKFNEFESCKIHQALSQDYNTWLEKI